MARDNTKSTKELILDTALSFYEEPVFKDFSMRELAEKVGVSKPAIYRHFTNKEAVVAAMEERVFDTLASYLQNISVDINESKTPLVILVDFFLQNPNYINYFLVQFSQNQNYEERVFLLLFERKVPFLQNYGSLEFFKKNIEKRTDFFVRQNYIGTSIVTFVKTIDILQKLGKMHSVPEQFSEKLIDFLILGFSGATKKGDLFFPDQISASRNAELRALCKIDENLLPAENRIFVALANVIRKFKPSGVTVERIADELGMAKSSLYEYFDNKKQMVKQLVNNEILLLQTIVNENSVEAANFTEYMFILIWTEFEYFSKRPSLIPICGWLLMMNDLTAKENWRNFSEDECGEIGNQWEKRLPERISSPDFGFDYPPRALIRWLGCLPIALFSHMSKKGWSEEKQREGLSVLLDLIVNGIK